jgi:hypothetical protein
MQFKNEEANEFLKEQRGVDLLKSYLANPRATTNASQIEVSSSKYP